MVVGIIAIVFGSLGVLGGAFGCIGVFFLGSFSQLLRSVPTNGAQGAPDTAAIGRSLEAMQIPGLLISTAGLVIAILLLWGGILLARRRAEARKVLLAWAVLKALFSVAKLFFDIASTQSLLSSEAMSSADGSGMEQFVTVVAIASNMLTMVWALALPVFMFVWFRRGTIREEMGTWSSEANRPMGAVLPE